jgi:hypothetical protein
MTPANEFDPTIDTRVLLPPARVVRRPRGTAFTIYRNQPIELDLTVFQNLIDRVRTTFTSTPIDLHARVFRDFEDPATLVSTKTIGSGLAFECRTGQFSMLLDKTDLSEPGALFVAIYINGAMIDLFQIDVRQSPLA